MGFAGTISLKAETIVQVHMEAVESLIAHGFKRFIILIAHTGNTAIVQMLVDKINQTTPGIAVNFDQAVSPFMEGAPSTTSTNPATPVLLDQHGGTGETSMSMYLMPALVQLDKAVLAKLTMPSHLQSMIPKVVANDPTAVLVFGAESLKAKETGKKTSSAEISTTGVFGERDPKESSAERGATATERGTQAAIKFIDRWNELRPFAPRK
jgi:creatinine amidohydrolase